MTEPDAEFDKLGSPAETRPADSFTRRPAHAEPETEPHPTNIFGLVERRFLGCLEPGELAKFDALITENPDALAYWNRLRGADASFAIPDQAIGEIHSHVGHSLPWLLAPYMGAGYPLSELAFPPAPHHESESPIPEP